MVDYHPFAADVQEDPHPVYARMRDYHTGKNHKW